MPDPRPADDFVRVPRVVLARVEGYFLQAVRRLADTPGVETQALAVEGEHVLLELAAARAQDDMKLSLWGLPGRPSLPSKSSKAEPPPPPIPPEVKT